MNKFGVTLSVFFISLIFFEGKGQEVETGYNPNSIHPIHEYDIMYKKRVWRRLDLNEKINKGFFASGNEITKIIIEAVRQGLLTPYEPQNDSANIPMTVEKFNENMTVPVEEVGLTEEEKALGFTEEDDAGWGDWGEETTDDGGEVTEEVEEASADYFFPNQVSIMEIKEDIIFDKKRSRLYYDIQTVKMIIPPENIPTGTGLQRPVATFRYKDLYELFRSMPEEALWFNRQNSREHKNLSDAFELRLFYARIIKVENPDGEFIQDRYNKSVKESLMASKWAENQIINFEHDLWEF